MGCGGSKTGSVSTSVMKTDVTELSSAEEIQDRATPHGVHSTSTVVLGYENSNANLNNNNKDNPNSTSSHIDEETHAATRIQAHYRGFVARKECRNQSESDSVFLRNGEEQQHAYENAKPGSKDSTVNHEKFTIREISNPIEDVCDPNPEPQPSVVVESEEAATAPQDVVPLQNHSENISKPHDEISSQSQDETVCKSKGENVQQSQDEVVPQAQDEAAHPVEDEIIVNQQQQQQDPIQDDTSPLTQEGAASEPQEESQPHAPEVDKNETLSSEAVIDACDSVSKLTKLIVSNSIGAALEKSSISSTKREVTTPPGSPAPEISGESQEEANSKETDVERIPKEVTPDSNEDPTTGSDKEGKKDAEESVGGAKMVGESTAEQEKEGEEGANVGETTSEGAQHKEERQEQLSLVEGSVHYM